MYDLAKKMGQQCLTISEGGPNLKSDFIYVYLMKIPVHKSSPNLPDFQITQKGTFDTTILMLMPQGT